MKIDLCSRTYFSEVILSGSVKGHLFPDNIIVVNCCLFETIRSNIDPILQESDGVFVEKFPQNRSALEPFRHACVKFAEWLAAVYTKDPVLFEAHLLHQLKRACEVINGDFIFLSFQDKALTPLARKVMEEKLQLQEHVWLSTKTLKLYEINASGSRGNKSLR